MKTLVGKLAKLRHLKPKGTETAEG